MKLMAFDSPQTEILVNADVDFVGDRVNLMFQIEDPQKRVLDGPRDGKAPGPRADELWRTTCLELFWSERNSTAYNEFNFAPATRAWNVYSFASERDPQPPQADPSVHLEQVDVSQGFVRVSLKLPKVPQLPEWNLCAVIRTEGQSFYYSLRHARTKADFHARESLQSSQ